MNLGLYRALTATLSDVGWAKALGRRPTISAESIGGPSAGSRPLSTRQFFTIPNRLASSARGRPTKRKLAASRRVLPVFARALREWRDLKPGRETQIQLADLIRWRIIPGCDVREK